MRRTWVLVMLLVWATSARADEVLLETMSVEELLGEMPMGLSVEGAQLWNGSLGDLANAATGLGETVALDEGANPDTSVTLVCNAPVPASLARAAVVAACRRLGAAQEGEDLRDLQVMITVVGAEQVEAMAALHHKLNLVGEGAVISEVPEAGAVIVVNTDDGLDLPPDPAALFDAMLRKPAEPVLAEGVEELGEDHYRVQRDVVRTLLVDAHRMARMVPNYRDGELGGFKLFSIRPSSVYSALRIRNGDIVVRVNGASIDSVHGVEGLLRGWLTDDAVTLEVQRRGQDKILRYEMVGEPIHIPERWALGPPTREQYMAEAGITEEDGAIVMPREYVLGLRETLPEDIHWRYALDEGDVVVGMRGAAQGGNLLHVLGLGRGEHIAAVDGVLITTPAVLMGLFTALRTSSEVILTVVRRDEERSVTVRVEGDPDPDPEPWSLALLDIAPTLSQTRAALGIDARDGVLIVPREVVLQLLEPVSMLRLTPTPIEAPEGYRLLFMTDHGRLDPLGLRSRDLIVAVDGEPVTSRDAATAILGRMFEAEALTLTLRRRGRPDETVALAFTGEAAALPPDWVQLQIEPTLDERRAAAGVAAEGDRITLPRAVVVEEGHDVLRWLPVLAGESVDGFVVPRRSRYWLSAYMGLRSQDVVLSFDGRDLDSDEARNALVDALLQGDGMTLLVMRDGRPIDIELAVTGEPAERPAGWDLGKRRRRR